MSTRTLMSFDGMPCSIPNTIKDVGNFYISYNDTDIGIYGYDTTALVKGQMERFYILNGDHRKAYDQLLSKGFDACLSYFKQNNNFMNKYSDKA